jgi:Raf kinase inhibitor-like YbhB/YbcL family protein
MIGRLLGKLLRGRHAGERLLLWNELPVGENERAAMILQSTAFTHGADIPRHHAGQGVGDDISPPLEWSGIATTVVELVLIIEDPDAPLRRPFVHLIAYGIPPTTTHLAEGALGAECADSPVTLGLSTFRKLGYSGPRALPAHGPHRYAFQLFALDQPSRLARGARREDLVAAMDGKVIARARLDGLFERP